MLDGTRAVGAKLNMYTSRGNASLAGHQNAEIGVALISRLSLCPLSLVVSDSLCITLPLPLFPPIRFLFLSLCVFACTSFSYPFISLSLSLSLSRFGRSSTQLTKRCPTRRWARRRTRSRQKTRERPWETCSATSSAGAKNRSNHNTQQRTPHCTATRKAR